MKPKIGLLSIAHKDYTTDVSKGFVNLAIKNIENIGCEVIFNGMSITNSLNSQEEAKKISKLDIDCVIIFIETWIDASVAMSAIRMIEHIPFLILGFPMFYNNSGKKDQTGSIVGYSVLKGSLDRLGYNYKSILGKIDDGNIINQVCSFVKAAHAYNRLKESRVGLFGYVSMSMYPGNFDHLLLRKIIGPEVIHFDTYTLIERIKNISDKETAGVTDFLKENFTISKHVTNKQLKIVSSMYLSLKDLIKEYSLNGLTIKCQYELSQNYGMTACIPLSLLSDDKIVSGCEGDMPTLISMLIFYYLSGDAIFYGDFLDFYEDNKVLFSSCGFAPFSLATKKKKSIIKNFIELESVISKKDIDSKFDTFKGLVNSSTLKPGKITFGRLVEKIGSYKFVCSTAAAFETELRQGIMPAMEAKLDCDTGNFLSNIASQHFAICYGDITDELRDLCTILNIEFIKID